MSHAPISHEGRAGLRRKGKDDHGGAIMTTPTVLPFEAAHFAKIACSKCKTRELRMWEPTIWDRITSFYRYKCMRCGHSQMRFRFEACLPPALLIIAMFGGGALVWANPPAVLSFKSAVAGSNSSVSPQEQAVARARAANGGELSGFEQMMLHKSKPALDNATVLRLVRARVSEAVIVQLIHTSAADFDLGADSIIAMKQAGVSEPLLLAMINVTYGNH